jgi:hypothetical protein
MRRFEQTGSPRHRYEFAKRDNCEGGLKPARRLQLEITMPLRWIAQGLKMDAAGSLANLLREA